MRLLRIGAHEFGTIENVSFHRVPYFFVRRSRRKVQFAIKSEEPCKIAVCTGRRTRAHVPNFATIIFALQAQARDRCLVRDILFDVPYAARML